jgi:hypothetical protein
LDVRERRRYQWNYAGKEAFLHVGEYRDHLRIMMGDGDDNSYWERRSKVVRHSEEWDGVSLEEESRWEWALDIA